MAPAKRDLPRLIGQRVELVDVDIVKNHPPCHRWEIENGNKEAPPSPDTRIEVDTTTASIENNFKEIPPVRQSVSQSVWQSVSEPDRQPASPPPSYLSFISPLLLLSPRQAPKRKRLESKPARRGRRIHIEGLFRGASVSRGEETSR